MSISSITEKDFLDKMNEIHPDLNFNEFKFVRISVYGIVECKKHGKFRKMPNQLMKGAGCKKCWRLSKILTQKNNFRKS